MHVVLVADYGVTEARWQLFAVARSYVASGDISIEEKFLTLSLVENQRQKAERNFENLWNQTL